MRNAIHTEASMKDSQGRHGLDSALPDNTKSETERTNGRKCCLFNEARELVRYTNKNRISVVRKEDALLLLLHFVWRCEKYT